MKKMPGTIQFFWMVHGTVLFGAFPFINFALNSLVSSCLTTNSIVDFTVCLDKVPTPLTAFT